MTQQVFGSVSAPAVQSSSTTRRTPLLVDFLPPSLSDTLLTVVHVVYRQVWTTQVCDLYTDASDPSFSGHCNLNSAQPQMPRAQCEWCDGHQQDDIRIFPEIQVASMLAEVRPQTRLARVFRDVSTETQRILAGSPSLRSVAFCAGAVLVGDGPNGHH
jgi:hypothetical protein